MPETKNNKVILTKPYAKWTESLWGADHIAVSTRVRLARNLAKRPFPQKLNDVAARELALQIKEVLYKNKTILQDALRDEKNLPNQEEDHWNYFEMESLSEVERQILVEKHFISQDLARRLPGRDVVINDAQNIAIMINEEDHLRMQCILPGLQLQKGWQEVSQLDDALANELDFAFDEKLGYLTSCPSNLGTGMRASVMLHLPALRMTEKLSGIFQQLPQIGLTVRGVYGEGSKSYGDLYQISNQISLGFTEEDIISRLQKVVEQIIEQEEKARTWLWQNNQRNLEDYIWRSYGILANARLITSKEAMEQISIMRLGVDLGVMKDISMAQLNQLMVNCQPAFLVMEQGKDLTVADRDWERAKVTRKYFQKKES